MRIIKKTEDKMQYTSLFDAYEHSIPVIYSSLNGQYPGELYIEDLNGHAIAMLFTPFCFHFVSGDRQATDAAALLHQMLFETYLAETQQKEAVVFTPDSAWYSNLDEVFQRHHGVKDVRKRFHLNRESFAKAAAAVVKPPGVKINLTEEQEGPVPYPVCRIMKDGNNVSFCSAFMLGKGHAELDVGTEEAFRRRGYAKLAAVTLISELLRREIEPDWCTWPYRTQSQVLAAAIGFESLPDVPVHIWTEDDCGKLAL